MKNVKYKVWTRIAEETTSYLVINMETKQVQSVWFRFIDARDQVSLLNKPSSRVLQEMLQCEF